MSTEEILKNFPPREVETQIEFETYMSELNNAQTKANHPFVDRLSELNRQPLEIEQRIKTLSAERDGLKLEKLGIEAQRKEINRVCHELKHQMITLNPREKFVKPETDAPTTEDLQKRIDEMVSRTRKLSV
jgi:uncharacterized protein (DUF3084 family)